LDLEVLDEVNQAIRKHFSGDEAMRAYLEKVYAGHRERPYQIFSRTNLQRDLFRDVGPDQLALLLVHDLQSFLGFCRKARRMMGPDGTAGQPFEYHELHEATYSARALRLVADTTPGHDVLVTLAALAEGPEMGEGFHLLLDSFGKFPPRCLELLFPPRDVLEQN
jgi:hypothetical protein